MEKPRFENSMIMFMSTDDFFVDNPEFCDRQ